MNLKDHLVRQMVWSKANFGPGARTDGVLDDIKKEIEEVRASNGSSVEWVDLVILSLDGLTRQLWASSNYGKPADDIAQTAVNMIVGKQSRNELRNWPDWRTQPQGKAIEHTKSEGGCPDCGTHHPPDGMCVV
jgi:hypothetical protein